MGLTRPQPPSEGCDSVLLGDLGSPEADLRPWTAYTLGFEPVMLRVWHELTGDTVIADPNLHNGVPMSARNLERAAGLLPESPPEIRGRLLRALGVVRAENEMGAEAALTGLPTPPRSFCNVLSRVAACADAYVPAGDRCEGWFVLGRTLAQHIWFCRMTPDNAQETSLRWVCEAARLLPEPERRRVADVSVLARLADDSSSDEGSLRRALVVHLSRPAAGVAVLARGVAETTSGAEPSESEVRERLRPDHWLREPFACHIRLSTTLRGLTKTPHWNPDGVVLEYDGEPVRTVSRQAGEVRYVLDAFETAGWPPLIRYTFDHSAHKSNVLKSLNKGILGNRIRFAGGGQLHTVQWGLGR
ncbi:MAG: hypothetical protein K2P78_07575 [Gemmataceae bacterium]|nr:hypothetical protein [Gemmataceae bacterium]